MGKTVFYLGWSHAYSWGSGLSGYLIFTIVDDVVAAMVPDAIIMATLTLSLCSLGLDATRRVVPCGRFAHLGLVR